MEQSLNFEKHKKRVENLLKRVDSEFLEKHYISLNRAVSIYSSLRYVYNDKNRELNFYVGFVEAFFKFYGIGRFVSDKFKMDFYEKLENVRYQEEYDLEKLVRELKDEEKEKFQFSFVTKLLNIMNDSKYPIYDSYVVKAFGLYYIPQRTDEEKIKQYMDHYKIITNVYDVLITENADKIKLFKRIFNTSEQLSDMRILDLIIWKKGELMVKNKI